MFEKNLLQFKYLKYLTMVHRQFLNSIHVDVAVVDDDEGANDN